LQRSGTRQARSTSASGAREGRSPASAPAATILLIEACLDDASTVERMLAGLDVGVERVPRIEDAVEPLRRGDLALVLLDIDALNGSGLDALEVTRRCADPASVIFLIITRTAPAEPLASALRELGFVDYLLEPLDPERLRARVSTLCSLRAHALHGARHAARCHDLERSLAVAHRDAREAQVRANGEHRRLTTRLAATDRQRDELLATLAHELRNPLAPVVTGLELLRPHTASNPDLEHTRTTMERQVHHLVRLVDDLLDASRISRGQISLRRDWIDLGDVVRRAIAPWQEEIRQRRHAVTLSVPDGPVSYHGDLVRLAQLVDNLLANAIRHTDADTLIEVHLTRTEGEIRMRVTDDGPGIAPNFLGRVFDMFVQARRGNGLGLGLPLAQQIARLHGGHITAHSRGPGTGSTFEVVLPLHRAPATEPDRPRPAVHAERSLRIVLIEDDPDVRETTQLLLEAWGHCVRVASTGLDGIDMVLETRPDVALVDLGLPDIDGHTAAARIRDLMGAHRPQLIALTGFGRERDRQRARDVGFDAHLLKPVQPPTLRATLAGRLAEHR
jgi:signal transduction histidine kinase